jgi:hypothetical protein
MRAWRGGEAGDGPMMAAPFVIPESVKARGGYWRYLEPAAVLAAHEAAHAVVALFLGRRIESATIDRPSREAGGLVRLVHEDRDPDVANLVIILAGPMAEGCPLEWPPVDIGHGDESTAALLVAALNLDFDGWRDAEEFARQVLEQPRVKRALRALQAALYDRGSLDGAEVHAIFDAAAGTSLPERNE